MAEVAYLLDGEVPGDAEALVAALARVLIAIAWQEERQGDGTITTDTADTTA